MKKIIYSVLLVFISFIFLGCDFGKNPFDDTEWEYYYCRVSFQGVISEQPCSGTLSFDKSGDFESTLGGEFISGSWNYDDTTLVLSYGGETESYSVDFNDNDDELILTLNDMNYSYTYYLTRVEKESIFDDLFN